MGLTIHFKLSIRENLSDTVVRDLADRTALYARKIGCAEVSEPLSAAGDDQLAPLFVQVGEPEVGCFNYVAPTVGWLVAVWPEKGCESAAFGLCQYPRRIPSRGGSVATGYESGWLLNGYCKTQYAGAHGWEHFLKCHRQIVSLLEFWRNLGATVEVTDEGEYWQTRSEEILKAKLQQYDGLVAAVAGMLKDASADKGEFSIESPIFDYVQFEQLEHEGRREFGGPIAQLRKEVREGLF